MNEMKTENMFRFHNNKMLLTSFMECLPTSSSSTSLSSSSTTSRVSATTYSIQTKTKSLLPSLLTSSTFSSLFLSKSNVKSPSLSTIAFIILLIVQIFLIKCCKTDPIESSTARNIISQASSAINSDSNRILNNNSKNNNNHNNNNSVQYSTSPSSSSSSSLSSLSTSGSTSTNVYVPVTTTPKVSKRAGTLAEAKLKKTVAVKETPIQNRSREALSHEGSEHESIVYLPDSSADYIPIQPYRSGGGRLPPSSTGSGSISSTITGGSNNGAGSYHHPPHSHHPPISHHNNGPIDIDTWRPDPWDRDYNKRLRYNNTRVQHIEAECQDDFMKIRIGFNGSFTGLLYSAGYAYDPDCMYINGSGRDYYEFYIQLNRCGTLGKNALHDDTRKNPTNFMWNTITVQYNPLIEEEFDEHFKVTCEYGYDFWKTVTFPFLDVEVATGNPVVFTLSPPECYMEIRNGYGISGTRVAGPVRVGDPLTLIIYMRSKYDGFDIVVNDCYAHNGANKRIQLIDEYGCPVDDKLISRFRGTWSDTGVYETQVYAFMKTFRFTGSPALYIECDVRMCHGRCPSQPCHWRNLKIVSKRDVSNQTSIVPKTTKIINDDSNNTDVNEEKKTVPLSENVNLFQSLRVLQEGEGDENDERVLPKRTLSTETCIRTTVLSALSATFSIILCILSASLMITCAKLKYRKKDSELYDAYVNHKGQID